RRRRRLPRWVRRSGVPFDVVVVPRHKALHTVLDVRWNSETVIFAWVYDEFGRAPKRLHGLVHLLTAQNRHVPIDVIAHEYLGDGDAIYTIILGIYVHRRC